MAHHHDDHSTEKKPVSFTVPFLMALTTLVAILALTSLGDPCHCKKECAEACCSAEGAEKGAHGDAAHGEPAKEAPAEHGGH